LIQTLSSYKEERQKTKKDRNEKEPSYETCTAIVRMKVYNC